MTCFCVQTPIAVLLLAAALSSFAAPWPSRSWQPVKGQAFDATYVTQNASTVQLALRTRTRTTIAKDQFSTTDLRYLRNISEITRPMRDWTFSSVDSRGTNTVKLKASFIELASIDTVRSEAWVVLVKDNGQKRAYPLKGFAEKDRAHVKRIVDKLPPPPPSPRFKDVTFVPDYDCYKPGKDDAIANFHETPHFLFYWGKKPTDAGKLWDDPKFRDMNYAYFEQLWHHFIDGYDLPLVVTGKTFPKINVFVTETGLPKHEHGWAFGSQAIMIDPRAMQEGSSVTPHEFGHSMQMRLGGFIENPMGGSFWETHANWQMHIFLPSVAGDVAHFADCAYYGVRSTLPRYQNWPFLQFLREHPRLDPFFNYQIWEHNPKNEFRESVETPIQTMLSWGVKSGAFTGTGEKEFGDIIGEMAAHNVTWDYVYQYAYLQADAGRVGKGGLAPRHRRLVPEPVPDKPGWFRPPQAQAPRAYGYNIIDLVPEPGATNITVELCGIPDSYEHADWRATIIAVDEKGNARYGKMWSRGSMTMEVRPGERVALAVAATPTVYRPRPWTWVGFNQLRRFPYEVSFKGCAPAMQPAGISTAGVAGKRHANGGGFVADTASVEPTAFVATNALVLGTAKVRGSARIESAAVVMDQATVVGNAVVADHALIAGAVTIQDNAHVRGTAVVQGGGKIADHALIAENIKVRCDGIIAGNATIKGSGDAIIPGKSVVNGSTIVGDVVIFNSQERKVSYGLFQGDVLNETLAGAVDYHGLLAHWDFNEPRTTVLKDAFGDADGVLRGAPAFTEHGPVNAFVTLNGSNQYATLEGHTFDTVDMTLDMRVNWDGGGADQPVFACGSVHGEAYFTPADSQGNAAFVIRKGADELRLAAPTPLPTHTWVRVTVALAGTHASLSIDGVSVATRADVQLHTGDVVPTVAYIGRSTDGTRMFAGSIDDIALYRVGVDAVAAVPDRWWVRERKGQWDVDAERDVIVGTATTSGPAVATYARHWQNYTFSANVRRTEGNGAVMLLFRTGYGDFRWLAGKDNNTKSAILFNGNDVVGAQADAALENNRWYTMKVVVNVDRFKCYLDGRLVHDTHMIQQGVGGIGIGVAEGKAEFKDLKVIGADGMLLLPSSAAGDSADGRRCGRWLLP